MRGLEQFIGEVLDNKYRVDHLLGKGGMGAVYLANHLGTERPVALKIIAPELMQSDEFVERFKREARAAGRLRHPNVVDVTDFGFTRIGSERIAYLVMEYLDGCTLADVLAEEKRLPLDWVLDILEQVCSAVDEAHQHGIVHRDLKPDNIWLEPNRLGGYRIKVLDFGIAKLGDVAADGSTDEPQRGAQSASPHARAESNPGMAGVPDSPPGPERLEVATQIYPPANLEETKTRTFEQRAKDPSEKGSAEEADTQILPPSDGESDQTRALDYGARKRSAAMNTARAGTVTRVGTILGTPLYMSPEQCRGEQLDARSDIYSLGTITYQMLSGETPFSGDMLSVMKMQKEAKPPPLREKNSRVPKRVSRLIMATLAKNPAERPTNAAAFARAMRASAEGSGSILRRSFALYSERFPTFLRISLLAFVPNIVLTLLQLGFDALKWLRPVPRLLDLTVVGGGGLLAFIANFLAASVISAATVLIVIQLSLAPLRPVRLGAAFAVLKRRWWPFLRAAMRIFLMFMIGFILFVIPGFIVIIRYAMYAPVVIVEGLEKRAAFTRAKELYRREKGAVILIVLLQMAVAMSLNIIATHYTAIATKAGANLSASLIKQLSPLMNIVLMPLFSIMTALLYLRARQIGGETFKETIDQFENQEIPRSKWQLRMRERLTTGTQSSRKSLR